MSHYLGVDIGGSSVKWTTADRDGDFSAVQSRKTPLKPSALVSLVSRIAGDVPAPLDGVCVGTPGQVDPEGTIRGAAVNLTNWGDRPLQEILAQELSLPVIVKNDTNLALLAESAIGAAAGCRNVLGVFLGTGVGGALLLDGRLYEGHGGLAGEIGHTVVDPTGPACGCGQRGCLERYASASGIQEQLRSRAEELRSPLAEWTREHQKSVPLAEFFRFLEDRDELARVVMDTALDALARAIGVAVNTLAPEMVVIGGGLVEGYPAIVEAVAARLERYSLKMSRRQSALVPAALGYRAGAIGAALFALERFSGSGRG